MIINMIYENKNLLLL